DREAIVARELRAPHPADQIQRRVERTIAADEALARQQVVAERDVIVGILPLRLCEQLRSAREPLVAGGLGIALPARGLDEEALCYVICEARADDGIHAEVLDAELAGVDADLEVLRVDVSRVDLPALELGLDDRRLSRVCSLDRAVASAAREPGGESRGQKKNEKPAFHSLISSLSSRLVNTT